MITNFTSANEIIARVYSDLNLQQDSRDSDIKEWIGIALGLMHVTGMDERVEIELNIKDYRAMLPVDYKSIEWVTINGRALVPVDPAPGKKATGRTGWTVQNRCIIFEDIPNGKTLVVYWRWRLDVTGFPLVPDTELFKEAIFQFIVMKLAAPTLLTDPRNYEYLRQLWLEAADRATADLAMPTPAEFEGMARNWNRAVPERDSFEHGFDDKGTDQFHTL